MLTITRKPEVKARLEHCLSAYPTGGMDALVATLHSQLLSHRVKFPLLEYCGRELYRVLPDHERIELCERVEALKTEGGNVILGMVLQGRLEDHFHTALDKAAVYISRADAWYVCDIIGERVFGHALLHEPAKTLPELERLARHPSNWVLRSLGAGCHYAIKKGLPRAETATVFRLLLGLGRATDKEVRQGIGWAAKTTAKFHPEIIATHRTLIDDKEKVGDWFRAKVEIGLERNRHARGN